MKLLVTGGAGFIGSNFIAYWLEKYPDHEIINLDALTYAGNLDNTKRFSDHPNYTFVEGSILNEKLVGELIENVDTVIHFAAETHVDRSIDNPDLFLETNVLGTNVLLRVAQEKNLKHFHHVSTDEVFGAIPLESDYKFTEDSPLDPRSPYAASKTAAEHLVRSYFHTYNLPITITNCSNNYGPYQNVEKFIPRAITDVLMGKPIKIYGDGKYVRDWLYVDDHCTAIEKVVNNGKIGETYVVGGQTDEVNNLEIAKIILETLGKNEDMLEFVTDRPGHDRKYAVNWRKIKSELDWSPKESFKTRMIETVNWYKDNEWYWKPQKEEVENFYAKIKR